MTTDVSLGFSEQATRWYHDLSTTELTAVEKRLRELARDPERAPFRVLTPEGRTIYTALAVVKGGRFWAHRIDFIRDEVMETRGRIPAIAILRGTPLQRK